MTPFLNALVDIATFIDRPKKTRVTCVRNHRSKPIHSVLNFPFRLQLLIAQAMLIIIHYVEMDTNTSYGTDFIFVGFSFKKSTQLLFQAHLYYN